jgi:hypothetical protein
MQARSAALCSTLLLGFGLAMAQMLPESPDWRESDVPPPPAFDVKRLIRVPGPAGSSLKFGIDPSTLAVTPEGVARYVIVASSADGGQNVMYEGIRCSTGQHRVYARYNAPEGWSVLNGSEWQPMYGSAGSRHALALSLAGVCKDRAVNRSAANIVRTLKSEQPGGFD